MSELKQYRLTIQDNQIKSNEQTNDFVIVDSTITIHQACRVILDYQTTTTCTIVLASSGIDLIEIYSCSSDATIHKNIVVQADKEVTRYVTNVATSNHICIKENVSVESNATLRCAYVEMSSTTLEMNVKYQLVGQGSNVQTRLGALSTTNDKKEITFSMEHLAPYTYANMDNYGVVQDQASLFIDGIGTIKKGNFQSATHQTNKIIVFDKGAKAKANPYLYIDEYDVKASHGASVGKIDEEHLYYLQSRGLTRNQAMHLVMYGYFLPVLEYIKDEYYQNEFSSLLESKVTI